MVGPISPPPPHSPFVSRGGLKLRHALDTFKVDVTGLVCADLGCSTGGFTDCLLQAGAVKVYALDTAYGELAWKLRKDPRVVVTERTNALHATPPSGGVALVVADLGWTPQRLLIPAALKWLATGASEMGSGRVISLIKPHYELRDQTPSALPRGGVLPEEVAERVVQGVVESMAAWGIRVIEITKSPVLGGRHKGKGAGNAEWLALIQPLPPA